MTDRELLELAAQAYWGDEIDDVVSIRYDEIEQCICFIHGDNQDHNGLDREYVWNPLTSSEDAFELAVRLQLSVTPYKRGVFISRNGGEFLNREEWGDDDSATTRLAITRAAASLAQEAQ